MNEPDAMNMIVVKEELQEEPDDAAENDEEYCLWHASPQRGDVAFAVVKEENGSEEEEVKPPLTVFLSPDQHLEECMQEKDPLALDAFCKAHPVDNMSLIKQETESDIKEEKFNEIGMDKSYPANKVRSPAEKILDVDCGFRQEVQLKEMDRNGATKNEEAFVCKICNKRLAAKDDFFRHINTHKGETQYESAVLRSWLKSLETRSSSPSDHTQFNCPVCGRYCAGRIGLSIHMKIHPAQKLYKCTDCGKGFTTESNLKTHTRTHAGGGLYKCNFCEKEFKYLSHLTEHIKFIHTDERPYVCSTCGKRFSKQQNLVTHSESHCGKRPFACSTCGKRFPRESGLVAHNSIHSGERLYQCKYCGKCFEDQSLLDNHSRVHTEERPFKCNICQREFKKPCNLAKHTRVHSREGHMPVASAKGGLRINAI